jgi:hypothetical protein
MVPGVKIVLASGNGPAQTLYYFRTDVSNSGLAGTGFLKFAATLGTGNALLKSASYLMHSGNFTQIRDFVLERSQQIVQDDSGIPLASFRPESWSFQPFGAYLGPIAVFPGRTQPRLGELFKKAKAPALDFGIGYRHRGHDSNLLLAVRKDQLRVGPPEAATHSVPVSTRPTPTAPLEPRPVPPVALPDPPPPAPPLERELAAEERRPAPAERQE